MLRSRQGANVAGRTERKMDSKETMVHIETLSAPGGHLKVFFVVVVVIYFCFNTSFYG